MEKYPELKKKICSETEDLVVFALEQYFCVIC